MGNLSVVRERLDDAVDSPDISHVRYRFGDELGRGAWGIVYSGWDLLTDKPVALKVQMRTQLAEGQREYRNWGELEVVTKEANPFSRCQHVVPSYAEKDSNGVPFIVMPKYDKTFSDLINSDGEPLYLGNGLSEYQIQIYLLGIAKGIEEVHMKLSRVHCDIKEDNIMVANNGELVIGDLGTSTYFAEDHSGPRDNMGCLFTRSPRLYFKGETPQRKDDIYAFAAIAFRLMKGHYPGEKEIRQAVTSGTLDELMNSWVAPRKDAGMFFFRRDEQDPNELIATRKFHNYIDKETKGIPYHFKGLVSSNLRGEEVSHSENLPNDVNRIMDEKYGRARQLEERKETGKILGLVAGLGLFFGILSVSSYVGKLQNPVPDYTNRTEKVIQTTMVGANHTQVKLVVEPELGMPAKEVNGGAENVRSIVEVLTESTIETLQERQIIVPKSEKTMRERVWSLIPYQEREHRRLNTYEKILPILFKFSTQISGVRESPYLDLEDSLAIGIFGVNRVRKAQYLTRSFDAHKYIYAVDRSGNVVFSPNDVQIFLDARERSLSVLHDITLTEFPERVQQESDLHPLELIEKSLEDESKE